MATAATKLHRLTSEGQSPRIFVNPAQVARVVVTDPPKGSEAYRLEVATEAGSSTVVCSAEALAKHLKALGCD